MLSENRKKILGLLLSLVLLLSLGACAEREPVKDTSPLTMYVGLGNTNSDYYEQLHDVLLTETGIDIQYVFSNSVDTTSAMQNKLEADDLPADIVITAMYIEPEIQKSVFLDLASSTNIPELFTVTRIQALSVDGGVYQLPFSSRLIGIEYNKTLMEEMGWELPDTFEEMVALKQEAEAAGYTFAISGGVATGHGFNYLFHLMGSQYLSTPDGSEWFHSFQEGTASVQPFAQRAEYFQRYAEAGLFGTIHSEDWGASGAFCRQRALFYYNILNDAYSYDGFRYNADGTLYGAEYDENGNLTVQADPAGEAVLADGEYVWYDPENPDYAGLERFTIPGAVVLHDEYGSMPWITENGSSNCYTSYDCMFLALDNKLGEPGQEERLAQAIKVLEFMTTKPATDLFSQLYADGYVALSSYAIDETRQYHAYAEHIRDGYLAPWYYNDFDADSIVNVGQLVNDYLLGSESVSFQDIMDELELRNRNNLNGTEEVLALVDETMDYEKSARVLAVSAALSAQQALDEAGSQTEITASLMPFIEQPSDISKSVRLGVVQEKFYAGKIRESRIQSYVNSLTRSSVVIQMTGAEIQALVSGGFNTLPDYELDHVFPYVCEIKGNGTLQDDVLYAVAVSKDSLESTVYEDFLARDRVILEGDEPVSGDTLEGLRLYLSDCDNLSQKGIVWN